MISPLYGVCIMDITCSANRNNDLWFAMRVTYRREFKVKKILDDAGIENYLPVHETLRVKHHRKVKETVPVVRGLIFVRTSQPVLQEIKTGLPFLQYIINKRTGDKIVVPDAQMSRFIAVTSTGNEKLLYFADNELNLTKGTRVRVTGGEFEGYEGIFLKVKGARDRRVVIEIEGVVAVALTTISPELIEVVREPEAKEVKSRQ